MRPLSVNCEMVVNIRVAALVLCLCLPASPTQAATKVPLKEQIERSLACEQKAHVLDVGLSHWTQEEIRRNQNQLGAQIGLIEHCLERGKLELKASRREWDERVARSNELRRHSAQHLREAALRSTISKLLNRTERRLPKLRRHLAD